MNVVAIVPRRGPGKMPMPAWVVATVVELEVDVTGTAAEVHLGVVMAEVMLGLVATT